MKPINIQQLIRKNILAVKPYSSARDEFSGTANIFLDANENSYGSIGSKGNNRYPDPHQTKLKNAIAAWKNISVENIFIGNGSDETIDIIYRVFCNPANDKVIIMPPTYGMYEVCANINDITVTNVLLTNNFEIDVKAVLEAMDEKTKLIFICSPNNPTANSFNYENIKTILTNFNGIVVIDEAYIDFSSKSSWLGELSNYPNLIIIQTFSKAWGLANLRLGIAFASKEIINIMTNIKPPYNVNGLTQAIGLEALTKVVEKNETIKNILKQRTVLIEQLKQFNFITTIYPTDANFILVKTNNPKAIYNYLLQKGIVVRDRSTQPLCEGCLRITVGTEHENSNLINALAQYK